MSSIDFEQDQRNLEIYLKLGPRNSGESPIPIDIVYGVETLGTGSFL